MAQNYRARRRSKKTKTILGSVGAALCAILLYLGYQFAPNGVEGLLGGLLGNGTTGAFVQMPDGFVMEDAQVKVHFIDVGQGDAILLQTPDQQILIDGGKNGQEDNLLAYLDAQKVSKLDAVIATHMHTDHIGGLPEVLEAIPVGSLLIPHTPEDMTPTTRTYEQLLDAADNRHVPMHETPADAVMDLGGGAKLTFLSPLDGEYDNLNETSLVCRLTYGDTAFMFTGDAETVNEKEMLQKYNPSQLRSDVLKLGHHGSTTSNSAAFVKAVAPAVAVATVGLNNEYWHPHEEIVKRIAQSNAMLYRSDMHGNVMIASDGKQIAVQTEKTAA